MVTVLLPSFPATCSSLRQELGTSPGAPASTRLLAEAPQPALQSLQTPLTRAAVHDCPSCALRYVRSTVPTLYVADSPKLEVFSKMAEDVSFLVLTGMPQESESCRVGENDPEIG